MIYTITFNPALDYIVEMQSYELGMTNRTTKETMFPGGKGINVSIVLKNLGMESTALGFTAGFTGAEIKRRLVDYGIRTEFIDIANGYSRINVKLKDYDGTEINGMGPEIDQDSLRQLMERLNGLQAGDVLILAGSIPKSMPDSIYREIMELLAGRDIIIVVDATKDLLLNVLALHPFMVKPNNHELGEIFGVTLKTAEEVMPYAKKLQEKGARNVLVSMAGEGAVLAAEDGRVYSLPAPKGKLVNAVGAGDSMVAGFVYGYMSSKDYETAFRYGVATGSASAFSENLATRPEVEALLEQLAQK